MRSTTRQSTNVALTQKKRRRSVGTNSKEGKEGKRAAKLSRLKKPEGMSLEQWQTELRRQFGREQDFRLKNLGDQPVFSEFEVFNPQSKSAYRVHIRGDRPGDNVCSCPDFATNTLGTCKHIEFTLARIERKRGGEAELRAGFQPAYSEVYLQYGARREVRFRPGTDCPKELARLAGRYFDSSGALRPDGFARFESFLTEAAEFDLRCGDDALSMIAEVRDAEHRVRKVAEAFPKGIRSAAFKDILSVPLYDYQREGALFAARAGRCLIGDEMGLGKTIQAIAAAEILARLFGVERVLIVCPTSLKHQWRREIERFVKRSVEVVGGMRRNREDGFASDTFFKITNYDTVHTDVDLIKSWGPDLVILDEAQRIKNWATRVARSVKRIVSPYAIVLTGTPLENRLEELISIVQFVDRYRLGPTYKLLHDHQLRDEAGKVIGYQNLNQIGETLAPILVRRQKDQVLDQLPERIDNHVYVAMTPLQMQHHTENKDLVARIVHKWRRYGFLTEADQRKLMIALLRMRMACDNSYLVDHRTDHGPKAEEALTVLEELFERPGTKAVVFSQWLRMHELLVERLQARKWDHVLFHGGVPGTQRQGLIDRFRDDPKCRLFLSTDAGGVGLNLQFASIVLNMDLPWNPAVLEQRIGRVHRLGQKQPVRVVNFVSRGTIEEGMLSVLKFKKSLFSGVLDGGEKDVILGGSKLNKFMESVEAATGAIREVAPEDADEVPEAVAGGGSEGDSSSGSRPKGQRAARESFREPTAAGLDAVSESEDEATASTPAAGDPWATLVQAGMGLLQQLAAPQAAGASGSGPKGTSSVPASSAFLRRDEQSGETYLKLPVPKPEFLDQAMKALASLLQAMGK